MAPAHSLNVIFKLAETAGQMARCDQFFQFKVHCEDALNCLVTLALFPCLNILMLAHEEDMDLHQLPEDYNRELTCVKTAFHARPETSQCSVL